METKPSNKEENHKKKIRIRKVHFKKIQQRSDELQLEKQSKEVKEKQLIGQPKSLSRTQTKVLMRQQEKSLCKIHNKNRFGSGFLCNIPDPVLITNYHILNRQDISPGKEVKISFNEEETFKTIFIDKNRKIYTIEKDEYGNEVDVTIIEIRPKEDDLLNQEFLEYDEHLLKNDVKDKYESKDIYVIQYKNGECFSSVGIINEVIRRNKTYDIEYRADTGFGSSGSPLILFNYKVVGIQRGFVPCEDYNFNIGTLLKFPIEEYNKKYAINILINVNEKNEIKCEEIIDKMKKKNLNFIENEKNEIVIKVKIEEKDIGEKINFLSYNGILSDYNEINEKNILLYINNIKIKFKTYFIPKTSGIYDIKLIFKFKLESCRGMFDRCHYLIDINLSNFNTEKVMDMSEMFYCCNNLTNINISNFKTQNVKNMNRMFDGCSNLTSINLSNFNTQNVTDMRLMFSCCYNLSDANLSNFNAQNVTDMSSMFCGCYNLTNIDLSNFITEKAEDMKSMFSCCYKLININLSKFYTQNVLNMSEMFYCCKNLTNIDLSNFNTDNVEDMSSMFCSCNSLTSIDLSNF